MKKIIFLILFISPFTTAFGEWIKFYEDELRIGYYENSKDFECFASNCEGRSFWVLTDFKKKNQDIQSKVEKVSFYCWQRKYTVSYQANYSKPMGKGLMLSMNSDGGLNLYPIPPNSYQDKLFETICNLKINR